MTVLMIWLSTTTVVTCAYGSFSFPVVLRLKGYKDLQNMSFSVHAAF